MGEKIRDIGTVTVGDEGFTIELNEAYTKGSERLIHIQNERHKLQLALSDFLKLSTDIIRAEAELKYQKRERKWVSSTKERSSCEDKTSVSDFEIINIFTDNSVDYRIVNIGNKLLSIMVKEGCKKRISVLLNNCGYKSVHHPYGKMCGYSFLYQMDEFGLFEKGGKYVEVFYQLPVLGLAPKTWIPLDKKIQGHVWSESVIAADGFTYLDEITEYIYRLSQVFFFYRSFSEADISFFEKKCNVLISTECRQLLATVFFSFEPIITKMLQEKKYHELLNMYYRFEEY